MKEIKYEVHLTGWKARVVLTAAIIIILNTIVTIPVFIIMGVK